MSTPAPILQYTLNNKDLLPAGYTPLAYIESTSTDSYINTEYKPTATTRLQFKVSNISGHYIGARPRTFDSTGSLMYSFYAQNDQFRKDWLGLTDLAPISNIYEVFAYSGNLYINGILYTANITKAALSSTNFYVGSTNGGGGGKGKFYYVKIWSDANTLSVDLRPARRDSDGVLGMYDLVSRTFKTNSGSGTFIAGPELAVGKGGGKSLPEEYLLVEYIRMPAGGMINPNFLVAAGTHFIAEQVMTFEQKSTGRDCSGINGSGSGYWEVGDGNKYGCYNLSSTVSGIRDKIVVDRPTSGSGRLYINGVNTIGSGDLNVGYYTVGGINGASNGVRWKEIEYLKITSDDVVQRNMFACYRKSDMKPGMYDTVNGVFYTNAGSGEFILGPTVCPYYSWEPNAAGLNMYPFDTTRTFTTTSSASGNRISQLGFNGNPGPWTISFDAYASTNITVLGDICDRGGKTFNLTTTKLHFFLNATAVDYYGPGSAHPTSYNGFWDMETNAAATIYISNIMMTHANGDVSYTPPNSKGLYTNVSSVYDSSKGWVADFTDNTAHLSTTIPAVGNNFSVAWWELSSNFNGNSMPWGIYPFNPLYSKCLNTGDGGSNPWYKLGTTTAIDNVTNNTWHHFVVTGNGSANYLYVDGVKYGLSKTFKGLTGTSLVINGFQLSTSYCRNPKISNFQIFNVALTDAQVKELYGK